MNHSTDHAREQTKSPDYQIIFADEGHYEAILALNEQLVHYLSPLSEERLRSIASLSEFMKVVVQGGRVLGFVIVMREGTAYDSENYRWFSQRYPAFLYIDRIAISPELHGRGVGKAIYQDLFHYARDKGLPRIAAEILSQPPNTPSLAFHRQNGFLEVGRLLASDGTKELSMQVKEIHL